LKENQAGRLAASAISKGCLLSGPPGTGKTSFARSLAKEAGVHFVATSYSQWQSSKDGHLGSVTAAIRASFAEAARNQPAILFIDEIDSIPKRGATNNYDEWWTAVVNTVLEQMDGFDRREGVVVIGACNDPSRLDPALVRAGRLDKHVKIPMPDTPALAGILRTHLGEDLNGADLLPAAVAARGGTGADVECWVRIARRTARVAQRPLTLDDVVTAIHDGEPELPPQVRRRIAYHESGHMVALIFLGIAEPHALSIHAAGGLAESTRGPIEAQTRSHLEKYLVCLLAGRASEELIFGEVTAGAGGPDGSDLSRATQLAMQIETAYGLGDLGPLWIGDAAGQGGLLLHDGLHQTVRRTLDKAYAAAKELIASNRNTLNQLAAALLARGYLDRSEIDAVLVETPLWTGATTDAPALQASQKSDPELGQTEIALATAPDANLPASAAAGCPT
jgi:ATP-dependent Zn protease